MELKARRARRSARRHGVDSADDLVTWAEEQSGQRIQVVTVDLSKAGVSGLTLRIADCDWVILDSAGSDWSRTLVLGHEIGHIVLGHLDEDGARRGCSSEDVPAAAAEVVCALVADVGAAVTAAGVQAVAGRQRFSDPDERNAEALGTELALLSLGGDPSLMDLNASSSRLRGRRIMSAFTGG